MRPITPEFVREQVALAELLFAGRARMQTPQDLPGRFGQAIRAIDHLLVVMSCEAVLCGGWAVWHHGYIARLTQDIDIVLPADRVQEFLHMAAISGFEIISQPQGRWPKVRHKDADVKVDVLPEGSRPGTAARPAPTTIPHPSRLGAVAGRLGYIDFPALIGLKLAAGRARDEADVVELIRANPDRVESVRSYLAGLHQDYAQAFDRLVQRAREQQDE
jgi:hypothetical protein